LKLTVLTLFPELLERYFATSILGKAVTSGRVTARAVDIREYASDRRRTCDDAPYGGGAGMVLMPEPLGRALDAVDAAGQHVLFPNPAGKRFTQADAWRLAQRDEIVLICGRYEGVDQRIIDLYVDEEVSIGDYVISSGELAAMVIIDAVYRLRDGMLRESSVSDESFEDGLLEYPHYTRPEHFRGRDVPEVLISGHHANIERWRRRQRIIRTARHRPDLLAEAPLSDEEIRFVREELGRSE
jgi:tRNA (guanine37-N1)-methyltransferase